ncbi:hypothetical protein [Tenacibaculum sp. 190524A05c]|uniref:hypothetical protein n=1 Tax=Tenacibaculum platacis TaxID=3137852 RepID=UPI0031FB6F06
MKKTILSLGKILNREDQKEIKGGSLSNKECTQECKLGSTSGGYGGCSQGEDCVRSGCWLFNKDYTENHGTKCVTTSPSSGGGLNSYDSIIVSK